MENPLTHIYRACNPYKRATAEYYMDLAEARGSSALTQKFKSHLESTDDYLSFLFSGHYGCGKSSELAELSRELERPDTPIRYFPVFLDADEYLDVYDTDIADFLLAVVTELAETLRNKMSFELKDNYFTERLNEIKEFFMSDIELKEIEFSLPVAKTKIQRLSRNPDARQQVRERLNPKVTTMLAEINTLFEKARLAVKQASIKAGERPYTDIVLILDNLEKIRVFAGKPEGIESQRELFLERARQLTGLRAHVIYTVPLRLIRSADGPQLAQRYDSEPFVLPMVKVIERGTRHAFQPGLECMRRLLAKRLGSMTLEDAFDPDGLEFLLTYSGGHVRNLMMFIREACTDADDSPIPLKAVHRGISPTVRTYSTAIPEPHWEKLAQLDNSTDQELDNGDEDYLTMLENLSVLEYINGGDDNPFAVSESWYAVNPIVRELQKFKSIKEKLKAGDSQ